MNFLFGSVSEVAGCRAERFEPDMCFDIPNTFGNGLFYRFGTGRFPALGKGGASRKTAVETVDMYDRSSENRAY